MTIREAIDANIRFLRRPIWASDYLELPLTGGGGFGYIATLHSPAFAEAIKITGDESLRPMIRQNIPMPMLLDDTCSDYEEFDPTDKEHGNEKD